jgi:hypothetical protein
MIASWLTDRQTVFSDRDIAALLMHIQKLSAVASKGQNAQNHYSLSMLSWVTGDCTLQSQMKLADVEEINAVIWFSDLRGSTSLAGSVT